MIRINKDELLFKKFPNGETILNSDLFKGLEESPEIELIYEDDADLIHLMFLRKWLNIKLLRIRYMPYSRQDRLMGSFTLKYVCQFINYLNFFEIVVDEPHSDVTLALLDNAYQGESVLDLLPEVYGKIGFDTSKDYILYPDAGAQKRYEAEGNTLVGFKKRDTSTGKITSLQILGERETDGVLAVIVDDLCSYGGTFMMAANSLRQMGFEQVHLVVYHLEDSVYRGDLLTSGLVDGFWCSDSMQQISKNSLVHILGE